MNFETLAAPAAPTPPAGPPYGPCLAGCIALAATYYAATGFTFLSTIVGAPPAIIACNAAFGACVAVCHAAT